MTEFLVAVFDTPITAMTAVDDLEAARLPSTVVAFDGPEERIKQTDMLGKRPTGSCLVTVSVDAIHADAAAAILNTERLFSGRLRLA